MHANPPSLQARLAQRISRLARREPGRVYTPNDFLDLGSPHSVGMALLRLVRAGTLRRIGRGLYDVPRRHPVLGELRPTADDIAQAIARKDGASLQPMEALAANLLGLSEQVPARAVFLTDGPARIVKVGSLIIQLKKRSIRQVGKPSSTSSLVFAALRSLGKSHATRERVSHLRDTLNAMDRKNLLKDLPLAPAWMHPLLRYIAGNDA